jgi:peptidoglycan-N-acetylglucosamine deacetylase
MMNRRILRAQALFIACVVAAAGGLGLLLLSPLSPYRAPARPPAHPRGAILTRVAITEKVVALTFDFDMTPGMLYRLQIGEVPAWYDPAVLDVLRDERIPHTIFLTGLATQAYPDLTRSFARDPLVEIGNHSHRHLAFTHDCFALPFIGEGRARDDIETAQRTIQAATGVTPRYFRFPGGCHTADDIAILTDLGLRIVHWDVAAGDAFNPDAGSIIRHVEARARPGSIVAFHVGGPNAPATAEALRAIIPYLRAHGYAFATVTGLLELEACEGRDPALTRFLPPGLIPPAWKKPCTDKPPIL